MAGAGAGGACRVVSWNIAFSGPPRAALQGAFLRSLQPDLVIIQELNPGSSSVVSDTAGLDWFKYSLDRSFIDVSQGRRRAAAVGRRGVHLLGILPQLLPLPLPDTVLAVRA